MLSCDGAVNRHDLCQIVATNILFAQPMEIMKEDEQAPHGGH